MLFFLNGASISSYESLSFHPFMPKNDSAHVVRFKNRDCFFKKIKHLNWCQHSVQLVHLIVVLK